MLFSVPEEIIELAEIFDKKHKTLFVVGGYVRSGILGLGREDDVDLCSSARPDEVLKMLNNTNFVARYLNKNTGVLEIERNGKVFEHATFRTEQYAIKGEHMPCDVEFITLPEKDALRRDFTCNAMYYDPLTCELFDPTNGRVDTKNRILRAVGSPDVLFKNDAERLLRMVRQSCSLGFDIDEFTWEAAKRNAFRLKFLSKARIRRELGKILTADKAYPALNLKTAHIRGFLMLFEMGAFKYMSPELQTTLESAVKINGQNVLDFVSTFLNFVPVECSLAAMLSVVGIEKYAKKGIVKGGFSQECIENAKYFLNSLEYPNKEKNEILSCVSIFEDALRDKITVARAREIMLTNSQNVNSIIEFASSVCSTKLLRKISVSKSANNLYIANKQFESKMYAQETNQLNISNFDILEIDGSLTAEEIAKIKNKLLIFGARKGKFLTKNQNFKLAKKFINK